ncbi:butyrophilin subfamily 1 member A1-like [Mobula hypostoma]|uniref:butyrophilin subfamily 1 member A1-like n=1 Tax=Mobula hypostoma TaxID=723540 RepID=UPI002FC36189
MTAHLVSIKTSSYKNPGVYNHQSPDRKVLSYPTAHAAQRPFTGPGAALPKSPPGLRGLSNSLLLPPVSVTLDVETANPELEVSEDRKSVRRTETRRNLPDTEKRFTSWPCVLGSEGFTSGRHYWEMEVSGNWVWWLGVAVESVQRKGRVRLSPETRFWVITQVDDVFGALTSPESRLPAGSIARRVGVYLSYESGIISFYNAETKSHLHTFTGNKFTGNLYPFFCTWDGNQCLRICSGSTPGLRKGRVPEQVSRVKSL